MSRFEDLLETVARYQVLAAENYGRIRTLAEDLKDGFCGYLGTDTGVCVHLVPPVGPFEPKAYGDQAFSIPPRGFRPLGPVSFGVAVRVTPGTDWLRITLECRKAGDVFTVQIQGGEEFEFELPLSDVDPDPFFDSLYNHIHSWFAVRIERYEEGDYGSREIGFDFTDGENSVSPAEGLTA
ncbi:MAG: hypothetical protein AAGJ32_03830 [Pseudomonadota bacterium]